MCLLFLPFQRQPLGAGNNCPNISSMFPEGKYPPCVGCSQIYFTQTEEILVSNRNNTLFVRAKEKNSYMTAPLSLSGPHSILYNPDDKLYYLNDTENNRILVFSSLKSGKIDKEITSIAGVKLVRPHDIVRDPVAGWLYTINPNDPIIFRFDKTGKKTSFLDLSNVLGYSRALSFIDGKLYIAGSSHGRIVEIADFDKGKYTVYQSADKKIPASSGNWQTNGLIINDMDFFRGYWYVSSYFYPSPSSIKLDNDKNKFIRFRNWNDFKTGNWQDLSGLLPIGLTPYYLTVQQNNLYIAMFNHVNPGHGDSIYKLSSRCPNLVPAILPLLK